MAIRPHLIPASLSRRPLIRPIQAPLLALCQIAFGPLRRIRFVGRHKGYSHARHPGSAGFTLLELIVVVAMIGVLAAIALPSLIDMPTRAKEATLKTNLRTIRQVIDQHYGDKGYYPASLDALVEEGYLRDVPLDPMTNDTDWELIYEDAGDGDYYYPAETDGPDDGAPGIQDVKSASEDLSLGDSQPYSEW